MSTPEQINGQEPTTTEQEVFEFKNPQNGQIVPLPKKVGDVDLQALIGQTIGKSYQNAKKEVETKYNPQLEQLKQAIQSKDATLEELQRKVQEFEEASLSEKERFQKQIEREKNSYLKQLDETSKKAEQFQSYFKNEKMNNEIYSAFSGFELVNPEQTMILLKTIGKADVKEIDGTFKTVLTINIDGVNEELTPKEAVAKWLALPENAHHLRNNLKPGGGTSTNGGRKSADGTINYTRSQLSNPQIRKEYTEKLRRNEPVNIIEG